MPGAAAGAVVRLIVPAAAGSAGVIGFGVALALGNTLALMPGKLSITGSLNPPNARAVNGIGATAWPAQTERPAAATANW